MKNPDYYITDLGRQNLNSKQLIIVDSVSDMYRPEHLKDKALLDQGYIASYAEQSSLDMPQESEAPETAKAPTLKTSKAPEPSP